MPNNINVICGSSPKILDFMSEVGDIAGGRFDRVIRIEANDSGELAWSVLGPEVKSSLADRYKEQNVASLTAALRKSLSIQIANTGLNQREYIGRLKARGLAVIDVATSGALEGRVVSAFIHDNFSDIATEPKVDVDIEEPLYEKNRLDFLGRTTEELAARVLVDKDINEPVRGEIAGKLFAVKHDIATQARNAESGIKDDLDHVKSSKEILKSLRTELLQNGADASDSSIQNIDETIKMICMEEITLELLLKKALDLTDKFEPFLTKLSEAAELLEDVDGTNSLKLKSIRDELREALTPRTTLDPNEINRVVKEACKELENVNLTCLAPGITDYVKSVIEETKLQAKSVAPPSLLSQAELAENYKVLSESISSVLQLPAAAVLDQNLRLDRDSEGDTTLKKELSLLSSELDSLSGTLASPDTKIDVKHARKMLDQTLLLLERTEGFLKTCVGSGLNSEPVLAIRNEIQDIELRARRDFIPTLKFSSSDITTVKGGIEDALAAISDIDMALKGVEPKKSGTEKLADTLVLCREKLDKLAGERDITDPIDYCERVNAVVREIFFLIKPFKTLGLDKSISTLNKVMEETLLETSESLEMRQQKTLAAQPIMLFLSEALTLASGLAERRANREIGSDEVSDAYRQQTQRFLGMSPEDKPVEGKKIGKEARATANKLPSSKETMLEMKELAEAKSLVSQSLEQGELTQLASGESQTVGPDEYRQQAKAAMSSEDKPVEGKRIGKGRGAAANKFPPSKETMLEMKEFELR